MEFQKLLGDEDSNSDNEDDSRTWSQDRTSQVSSISGSRNAREKRLAFILSIIYFFIMETLKTIIFPFTQTSSLETCEPLGDPLKTFTPKMGTEESQRLQTPSTSTPEAKVNESYIFCIDETSVFPNYVNVILKSPRISVNPVVPAACLPKKFVLGNSYFSWSKNIFIENYGKISDESMKLTESINVSQVCSNDNWKARTISLRKPVYPSRVFYSQFFYESSKSVAIFQRFSSTLNSLYDVRSRSVSYAHSSYIQGRPANESKYSTPFITSKRRSQASRSKGNKTDSQSVADVYYSEICRRENEEAKRHVVEKLALSTYQSRIAYLDSVITYLKEEAESLSIVIEPLFVKMVIAIYFVMIMCSIIFMMPTPYHHESEDELMERTLIIFSLMCCQVILVIIYMMEFRKKKMVVAFFIMKKHINRFHFSLRKLKCAKVTCSVITRIPCHCYILMFLTTCLLTDVLATRNPLPVISGVILILIGTYFSIQPKQIPWNTVILCYVLQYVFAKFLFDIKTVNNYFNKMTVLNLIFYINLCDFLPKIIGNFFDNYNFVVYWTNMTIMANFFLEIMKYLKVFSIPFDVLSPLSHFLAVTKVEVSYLFTGGMLSYRQTISLNSNMLKLLTQSEMFFLLITLSSTVTYGTIVTYQILGIPFGHSLRFLLISAPGIIATAKLLYPETQKSKTAHRGLLSTHDSVTCSTGLLTNVWISAIYESTKNFVITFSVIIGTVMILEFVRVILKAALSLKVSLDLTDALSHVLAPFMLLLGVSTMNDAQAVSLCLVHRVLINHYYAALTYSDFLHQSWSLDCIKKNYGNFSTTKMIQNERHILRVTTDRQAFTFKLPIVSDRGLFIALPMVTTSFGVAETIHIFAFVVSVLPQRLIKSTVSMVKRVVIGTLIVNFMTTIMASLVYGDHNSIECASNSKVHFVGGKEFCALFLNFVGGNENQSTQTQHLCFEIATSTSN